MRQEPELDRTHPLGEAQRTKLEIDAPKHSGDVLGVPEPPSFSQPL